jgi:hypothetical protein
MNLHPDVLLDLSRQRQAQFIAEAARHHRVIEARHANGGRRRGGLVRAIARWTPALRRRPAATLAECVPAAAE